jgi:hypothetical protein
MTQVVKHLPSKHFQTPILMGVERIKENDEGDEFNYDML